MDISETVPQRPAPDGRSARAGKHGGRSRPSCRPRPLAIISSMAKLTRLRDVRQRKALTQQQLADRAGVNRVTIARIEGGKDEPFPTTVRKVADALGVEPEELLAPAPEPLTNGLMLKHSEDIAVGDRIAVVNAPEVTRLLQAHPD